MAQWAELFGEKSLDTWQVRTSNLKTVLGELIEVCRVAQFEHEPYRGNLPDLLDEACAIARVDPIIGSHYPFATAYLEKLSPSTELSNLQRQAKILLEYLSSYRGNVVGDVRSLLSRSDAENEKEHLTKLSTSLATEFACGSVSTGHLRDALRHLLDTSEPDFLRRFDRLVGHCSPPEQEFSCTLWVAWYPAVLSEPGSDAAGVVFRRGPPGATEQMTPIEREFYANARSDEIYADVTVTALTCPPEAGPLEV